MPAPVALTLYLPLAPVDEKEAFTGSGEGALVEIPSIP